MTLRTPSPSLLPDGVRKLLRKRIEHRLELPLQSTTAAQVIALCNDERCDAQLLSELLSLDQALAGHVLGVANSAAYGTREPIVSLQQAVSRLGTGTICEVALAVSLKGKVFDVPGYALRVRELWVHSAAAAVYAKEVARSLRASVEGAFLCGLLHDVGKPIVLQNLIDLARAKTDIPVPPGIIESAMDEFHESVGARMVSHWDLPDWMGAVVSNHHDPFDLEEYAQEAMITRLGDLLATWALSEDAEEVEFVGDPRIHSGLSLYPDDLSALVALRPQVLEITEAFL